MMVAGNPKLLIVLLGVFLSVIWLVIGLLITGLKPKTNIIRLMLILFWLAIGLLFVGTDCFVRVEASARLNYPADCGLLAHLLAHCLDHVALALCP